MEDKERVRDAVDIADVIGEYVELERRSGRYWGLCPFHREEEPSFCVTPDMGIYKCFGCDASGDVFDFIRAMESVDFIGALNQLADRAGIELETGDGSEDSPSRTAILREAKQLYHDLLMSEYGQPARDYLDEIGIDPEPHDLGYAPDMSDALLDALVQRGYEESTVQAAGLADETDRLNDRIVFPVGSYPRGFIGFDYTGRQNQSWVRTNTTELFHPSRSLYGHDQAARTNDSTIHCFLDPLSVLYARNQGIEPSVGLLGCKPDPDAFRGVNDTVRTVRLIGDDRVDNRTLQTIGETILRAGLDVRIVFITGCSYESLEELNETTGQSLVKRMVEQPDEPPRKRAFRVNDLIQNLPVIQRNQYQQMIQRHTGVSVQSGRTDSTSSLPQYRERFLLVQAVQFPERYTEKLDRLNSADFSTDRLQTAFRQMVSYVTDQPDKPVSDLDDPLGCIVTEATGQIDETVLNRVKPDNLIRTIKTIDRTTNDRRNVQQALAGLTEPGLTEEKKALLRELQSQPQEGDHE